MGTFTYMVAEEQKEYAAAVVPGDTRANVAAELRSKGLSVIAAALEGVITNHVCGVIQPGHEEQWRQTLEIDIVDLVKKRYLYRDQSLRQGPAADKPDPQFRPWMI